MNFRYKCDTDIDWLNNKYCNRRCDWRTNQYKEWPKIKASIIYHLSTSLANNTHILVQQRSKKIISAEKHLLYHLEQKRVKTCFITIIWIKALIANDWSMVFSLNMIGQSYFLIKYDWSIIIVYCNNRTRTIRIYETCNNFSR